MKIKFSTRGGLTFSFKQNETFKAGTRYRYVVDNEASEVIILPDENGKYKLSKKGVYEKPLVDLRNKEIREAMAMARYMEVEVRDDKIIVHIIKTSVNFDTKSDAEIADIIDKSDKVTFSINKEDLERNHEALSDMLRSAGLYSAKMREDISYVFDVGSLFSGAGPLDLPYARDDSFDILFATDWDESAVKTYKENIGDHILRMDIRELSSDMVPDVDLIIGGPCCQGYSNEARNKNEEQRKFKRQLTEHYVRIVKEKHPLMFVMENVPQLLTAENGKYLEMILAGLSDYNITYSIVNDNDVGGYTNRKRVILVGSVKEMGKIIIPDVELNRKKTAGDAIKKVTPEWYNYNDITKSKADVVEAMSYVRPGHNYKDIPESVKKFGPSTHANRYRRLAWDEPAPTITNWRRPIMMPPEGNRILSVSEAAALMGLDKTFKVLGTLNDKQQQIGNCVTQAMAHFIKSITKNALYRYVNEMTGLSLVAA